MSLRLAVIGDGIVAAYAAAAGYDAGAQVDVFSLKGEPTAPPPGAFYLYDLPPRMKDSWPASEHHETLLGLEVASYTRRMWGRVLRSSVDSLLDELVAEKRGSRVRLVWYPTPELMREMFAEATWLTVERPVSNADVEAMAEDYDIVAVAAPISFVEYRPTIKKMPVVSAHPEHVGDLPSQVLRSSFEDVRATARALSTEHLTIYAASSSLPWLRATLNPWLVSFELPPTSLESPDHWALELDPDSCLAELRARATWVPKIEPGSELLNIAPEPNVVLCGRWATWRRSELSHETYSRVLEALQDEELLRGIVS